MWSANLWNTIQNFLCSAKNLQQAECLHLALPPPTGAAANWEILIQRLVWKWKWNFASEHLNLRILSDFLSLGMWWFWSLWVLHKIAASVGGGQCLCVDTSRRKSIGANWSIKEIQMEQTMQLTATAVTASALLRTLTLQNNQTLCDRGISRKERNEPAWLIKKHWFATNNVSHKGGVKNDSHWWVTICHAEWCWVLATFWNLFCPPLKVQACCCSVILVIQKFWIQPWFCRPLLTFITKLMCSHSIFQDFLALTRCEKSELDSVLSATQGCHPTTDPRCDHFLLFAQHRTPCDRNPSHSFVITFVRVILRVSY